MARAFASIAAFLDHGFDTVIDVRSPAEFAEDRIPGAISLPVLSDAERARVGTIYVQESPFAARKLGAALVARNAAAHLEGPLAAMEGSWRPLVYCWRGGQRSASFATILGAVGWRVETVEGGYRTWRRLVQGLLHGARLPHRFVLLDGNTGTAKTELLAALRARGVQVIDLEALAVHRGSILGAVPAPQPAQKGFESLLAAELERADLRRPVLLEAESSRIGRLILPPALWSAMCAAPRIEVSAPVADRAAYLARSYADLRDDEGRLIGALGTLRRLHGHARVDRWVALARAGAHEALARALIEEHYDPAYARSRARHPAGLIGRIGAGPLDPAGIGRAADAIAGLLSDR